MTRYPSVILASCLLYGHAVLADTAAPGNTATGQQWQPAVSLNNTATPVSGTPAPVDVPARPVEGDVPPPQSGNSQASQASQAESATDIARAVTLPLPPEDITQLRKEYDDLQRHSAFNPLTVVPRIRSLTVKLTPGASLPMMQVLPNYPGVINFTDQNGAPWPVAAPPINGNEKGFRVV
ncbi:TPA: DotH/IcmK family type IV secretion protein, partial [Escherichia coli]